ncbi:ABC transporter permease [Advenella mimigardefordensis]|uniref:Putative dipeptide transport system permease protein DppC n=1 Tax=Advenella mimigardefordensis (strain DSM 17166 / LMG 22922 / DPN7) TaxID=1247726 RepID=W0PMA5_ADVMD|nr:ABC transporter permease [Advenella mimigardefordensis]AHG66138.1 putative dipeptide transport system permease protein DppC [Advenella mimigardefordensis DPN7]
MKSNINTNLLLGSLLCGVILTAALLGAFWTPFDPMALDFGHRLQAPDAIYWLGTDEFGRDTFSRILYGATTSVGISFMTVFIAMFVGTVLGLIAGYVRGWVDRIMMCFTDALLAFPGILLALGLLAVVGANKYGIVVALGVAYLPSVLRLVRGTVLPLREREFIHASRIMGNSETFILFRHILPNCFGPMIVLATSMFGWVLLAESSLSFLGLGVPPPAPTWGNMLAGSRPFMMQASWLGIFPGLCISMTLLGINLLGDALQDKLDPYAKGK